MDAEKRDRTSRTPRRRVAAGAAASDGSASAPSSPGSSPAPSPTPAPASSSRLPRPARAHPATSGNGGAPADAMQLQLLDDGPRPDWRLDESTKAIGLHGVAQARAALRTARRRHAELQPQGERQGGQATAA